MQSTAIAGFAQGLDQTDRKPLLRRMTERFRAMRLQAEMALVDPRLREDAGLLPGSATTWPQSPAG